MKSLIRVITTFFFIGYFPVMPGSLASAAGALIAISLRDYDIFYVLIWCLVTVLGFLFSGQMEAFEGKKDPSCVVIDEVCGIMIAFFLLPAKFSVWITAFFLFRAFDMFKIYPANAFERKKGGVGIMMDDVIAGLYANLIMHVAVRFISFT
jgi:phosphatidylglycerophosphatase A